MLLDMVQDICSKSSALSAEPRATAAATQGDIRMNLTGTTTTLYASGHAWGLYYNFKTHKPRNEAVCIYRKTTNTTWEECGSGSGTTYIYTSELTICPLPGVYEGYASLFVNGVKKMKDYGTAIVG
jgi:hypothetical protein